MGGDSQLMVGQCGLAINLGSLGLQRGLELVEWEHQRLRLRVYGTLTHLEARRREMARDLLINLVDVIGFILLRRHNLRGRHDGQDKRGTRGAPH
jgi:hypothetical protein